MVLRSFFFFFSCCQFVVDSGGIICHPSSTAKGTKYSFNYDQDLRVLIVFIGTLIMVFR
jgi:hypothetical protein